MALEEWLVHRDRLDRDDALVGIEALDAVDQQHRIAMRQRRHHPLDVERADGGAGRLVVHSGLAALRLLLEPALPGAVVAMRRKRRVERREHVVGDVDGRGRSRASSPISTHDVRAALCITCW